ncbi:hypothetical protein [Actibacterium pelagium]|uniref:Outer membrane protein beta-barrel domain-containing protein n=1 Tax=Actibacterium pelagium TaxID=2029103 RepID=A0A917AMP9_9RHOB|nr:hypothetical protein [Actibacterium pelagium]GGE60821.1 hypothetical protein GCM10011517_30410 [Actibacterium pelagium]
MTAKVLAFLMAGTALIGTPASAIEFEAAHADFSYSTLRDEADGHRFGLNMGAEYQVLSGSNVQLNSGLNYYNGDDNWQGDLSAHMIYTPLETFALGGYLGYEGFAGYNTFFGGLEVRVDLGNFTAQSYFQKGIADGEELNTWGLRARYTLSPGLSIGVFYDSAEFPGATNYGRSGLGVDYRIDSGFAVFAKAGRIDYSESGGRNDTDYGFIEIGGRVIFGGNGQTTFDKRSVFGVAQGQSRPNL